MDDDDRPFDPERYIHKSFYAEMRDNLTGCVRNVHLDLRWYEHSQFMWEEGNFSCDCNRGMFFYGDHTLDFPCSSWTDQRFTILKFTFPDGTELVPSH